MSLDWVARIARWARLGAWAGVVLVLVIPLAAVLADLGWGQEVLLIAPHDPSVVALNRSLWVAGDPVAELYGSPMSAPVRVLRFSRLEVIHPEEDSSLALLPVPAAGRGPVQTRTLWWAVRLLEVGVGVAAFGMTILAFFVLERRRLNAGATRD